MDFKYLHTFKTIIEEGSFNKAAAKLHYTQSTITFQVSQLEQEFSTKLFEKVGRRMALTKAGAQLVPYVDDVLLSLDKMRYFKNDLEGCRGDLHIGVAETVLCYRLPAILKAFHKRAPNARLLLRSMNCYDIRDELLSGKLDLGLFYEDVGGFGTTLTTYPLGRYAVVLAASPETRLQYPDFRTPDQALPIPFIINEPNCIFRQKFEDYMRERSIRLDHVIELWSIPTIINLIKSNVGVSFLPRFTIEGELQSGELEEVTIDMPHPYLSAVCAHHKSKWISPLMQLFIELATEQQGVMRAAAKAEA